MTEINFKLISKQFPISSSAKYKLLRESSDNLVYLIKDGINKYVLRVSKRDLGDDINFEINWINALNKKGVMVAPVLPTKDNRLFGLLDKNAVSVFKFIDGYHVEVTKNKKPDLSVVSLAANSLANLHNQSQKINLDLPRKRTIFSELERVMKMSHVFITMVPNGKKFVQDVEEYLDWAKSQNVNKVLVHNDFRPSNIIFIDNKKAVIIDFDWSCLGPAIKDLAHSLAEWSFPDGAKIYWEDVFEIFIQTYNQFANNPIPLDKELYKWICFSCLSDTATFICDRIEQGIYKDITSSYMYSKFKYFLNFNK